MPYKDTDTLVTDCQGVGVEAYGKFLGTAAVASIFEARPPGFFIS